MESKGSPYGILNRGGAPLGDGASPGGPLWGGGSPSGLSPGPVPTDQGSREPGRAGLGRASPA